MKEKEVGKIKSFKYDTNTDDLEITIKITDPKFRKKIMRDFSLAGKLKVEEDIVLYNSEEVD
tara:strand:- start:11834 stop:12019 length:186 start_codon:yes stop_codon:yes gene_type:complete